VVASSIVMWSSRGWVELFCPQQCGLAGYQIDGCRTVKELGLKFGCVLRLAVRMSAFSYSRLV
jgi:hypothetical protein